MRLLIIGILSVGGAVLGWDTASNHTSKSHVTTASIRKPSPIVQPESSTFVVVSVPSAVSSEEERAQKVVRLEARNRRLEALVRVLKNREIERQP